MNKIKIIGVWKKVSEKPLLEDGTIIKEPDQWNMIKIITDKYFMFAEQSQERLKLNKNFTDKEFHNSLLSFFGGAGTYTFDGINYIEKIEIFLNPNYIGVSIPYKCEFKNGLMIHTGIFPVQSVGLKEPDYEVCEVWERVE